MNASPQITAPPRATTELLRLPIVAERTNITVVANDPEDDILNFVWSVPHGDPNDVSEFQADNGDWVSTLFLDRDDVVDEDVISCSITDQAQPRNVVRVEWKVEVP